MLSCISCAVDHEKAFLDHHIPVCCTVFSNIHLDHKVRVKVKFEKCMTGDNASKGKEIHPVVRVV